ncbi:MAG: phage protein [Lachnospiraceae bacterium]|jgi:hypothetical protein|nr:phage protein [Lachnospiraceae bacterium]
MKNTLGDLNNHLFAQLERLGDEELTGEELHEEITRAKAINDVASRIIANANTVLQAKKATQDFLEEYGVEGKLPKMLEG